MASTITSRRYPIGIQAFEIIRRDGYVYVDKTAFVYDLAHTSGKTFFLSRPRRFGKSLLVSTIAAYFEGRRELFEGTEIERLEHDWISYPVIRIDLSPVKTQDVAELRILLDQVLRSQEDRFGHDPNELTPGSRLRGLITRATRQTGRPAVLLVDEYDAPLLNVVDKPETLDAFRAVMREFYAPLKACDADLRLTFITGITKFSQLSIFSELNNIRNISMDAQYAAICGISERELQTQLEPDVALFAERLGVSPAKAHEQLKQHYDGYHFADISPDIYNPFSLFSAFAEGRIKPYWFGSGTPTFLIDLLKKQRWDIIDLNGCVAREESFDAPAESLDTPLPLLYQGGYLTIKSYDTIREAYTLGIPNEEVSHGLSKYLVQYAAPNALLEHYGFLDRFADALRAGDVEEALRGMKAYLSDIPYHLGSHDERGFQTLFYLVFDLLGIQIETEFKTATGRIDAVVQTDAHVFVFEFKYDKSARTALEQIDEKGYALPFSTDARKLVKIGVNFSSKTRTIDEWIIEGA